MSLEVSDPIVVRVRPVTCHYPNTTVFAFMNSRMPNDPSSRP